MVNSHVSASASTSESSVTNKVFPSTPSPPNPHSPYQPHQAPDAVVPDQPFKLDADIERASASGSILHSDPYQFRDGIVDDEAIAQLRSRRKGKRIAKYQRRQNDVSLNFLHLGCSFLTLLQLITSLLKPMEEHTEEAQSEEEAARLPVIDTYPLSPLSPLIHFPR